MLTFLLLAGSLALFIWVLFGPLLGWFLALERTPGAALRWQVGLILWNFLVVFSFWLIRNEFLPPEPDTLHGRALGILSFILLVLSFLGGLAGCFGVMSPFAGLLWMLCLPLMVGFGGDLYEGVTALVRPTYDLHTYQITKIHRDPEDHSVWVSLARRPGDSGEDFSDEQIYLTEKGTAWLAQQSGPKEVTVNVLIREAYLPDEVTYPASHTSRRLLDLSVIAYTLLYPVLVTAILWFAAAPARRSGQTMKKNLLT